MQTNQQRGQQMHSICKVRVTGRVQGVFFRDSTRRQALNHGINGYAINLSDGSVEILLSGERTAVETVVAWITAGGPPAARVDSIDVQPLESDGGVTGFTTG